MHYVSCGVLFNASDTLLPLKIRSDARFPLVLLVALYASGIGGAVLTSISLWQLIHASNSSTSPTQQQIMITTSQSCALLAFSLTTIFTLSCTVLHQRELLRSLLKSFDFGFNKLQLASMHICICVLYDDWLVATCVAGASQLWTYWVLTLDALTPLMKAKLGFHIRFAVPVVVLGMLWHSALLYHILSDSGPLDRVIWEGKLLTHQLQIRVVPFYLGRLVTLVPWFMRILWRLARASNIEVIILRATVTYQPPPSHRRGGRKHTPSSSPIAGAVAEIIGTPSNRIVPSSGPTRGEARSEGEGPRGLVDVVPVSDRVAPHAKKDPS